jgi:catechol 2,3-dioxygenase-like lactoylglutathione lyase family enzyme
MPILSVRDMSASLEFYTQKLGFKNMWEWGDPATFASISRDGVTIYLAQGDQGQSGTWLYLVVNDVDAIHHELDAKGLAPLEPPRDRPWGMREMLVEDPDGHRLRIGSVRDMAALPGKK